MSVFVDERWSSDPRGWFFCGDLLIEADGVDPSRYVVSQASTGERLLSGRVPPSGAVDFEWWASGLAASAAEYGLAIPADGLESWLDAAQLAVDDLIERDSQEREEWERSILGRTAEELLGEVAEDVDWIIEGVLPRGFSLGVAGREKIGKGTWIFSLLAAAEAQGLTAYVVTEEPPESVREKVEAFGLRRSRIVYGHELRKHEAGWEAQVARVVREAVVGAHTFVFVDNVSRSTGAEDESGVELARRAELLLDACRGAGLTFIGDFHHKKGRGALEDKFRGGTAVPGSLDVIVDVERVGRDTRRRRLTSRGRLRANAWTRVVELAEDGRSYREVADDEAPGDAPADLGEMLERGDRPSTDLAMGDRMALMALGATTAEAFSKRVARTEATARKRLNALVAEGFARKIEGGVTAEGRAPDTWVAVDPSLAPEPTETSVPSDGSTGLESPHEHT